jgi:hypothetical protein
MRSCASLKVLALYGQSQAVMIKKLFVFPQQIPALPKGAWLDRGTPYRKLVFVDIQHRNGWWLHCLAVGCRTPISRWASFRSEAHAFAAGRSRQRKTNRNRRTSVSISAWARGSFFTDANEVGIDSPSKRSA